MGPLKNNGRNAFSRREFVGLSWGVSLAGLFVQAGAALARFLRPRIEPGGFGTEVVAGRADEFLPGSVSHIQEGRFYLSRLEDGSFLALWHSCTHLGCTVPWVEEEYRFHCPCHSSIFTSTGEVVSGPAPRPMDLFPIRVVDGELVVNTGQPVRRREFDPGQATRI